MRASRRRPTRRDEATPTASRSTSCCERSRSTRRRVAEEDRTRLRDRSPRRRGAWATSATGRIVPSIERCRRPCCADDAIAPAHDGNGAPATARRRCRRRRSHADRAAIGERRRAMSPADASTVIAIADDEYPPDAVYVEGDLGGPDTSGDRPIVFIDDDVVVTETPEDSRRPAAPHRAAAARAADRGAPRRGPTPPAVARRSPCSCSLLAGAGARRVRLVAVRDRGRPGDASSGNVYTDRDRLQAVVDDLVGTPVLAADTQAAERELEAIPWVDEARVAHRLPARRDDRDPRAGRARDVRRPRRAVPGASTATGGCST